MLLALFRDYKPLTFFGSVGLILILAGFVLLLFDFLQVGFVPRIPAIVVAVGSIISGMLAITVGLVLHTIVRRSQEMDHQLRILMDEMRYQIKQELDRKSED